MAPYETASTRLDSIYGTARLHVFSFGPHEEDNLLCVDARPDGGPAGGRVLVRVQSACYTGEIFRSRDCDCHEQLDESLRLVHARRGLLVYMLCDGRGAGLLTKIRGLALGDEEGLDTHDAYVRLGSPVDPREYGRVVAVLKAAGVRAVELLTNNPAKVEGLRQGGLDVVRASLQIDATDGSRDYLATKRSKMGHLLD